MQGDKMAKVVVTAQVEDLVKWERGFRTHGDLFRTQGVSKPIDFGGTDGNHVAVCIEHDDAATVLKAVNSPATAEAMAFDGVKQDTVKVFVLDKTYRFCRAGNGHQRILFVERTGYRATPRAKLHGRPYDQR